MLRGMGEGLIPSDVTGKGPCGSELRLRRTTVGWCPGRGQREEGSLTVWFSLAPPGPTVRSPETDSQSNGIIAV